MQQADSISQLYLMFHKLILTTAIQWMLAWFQKGTSQQAPRSRIVLWLAFQQYLEYSLEDRSRAHHGVLLSLWAVIDANLSGVCVATEAGDELGVVGGEHNWSKGMQKGLA